MLFKIKSAGLHYATYMYIHFISHDEVQRRYFEQAIVRMCKLEFNFQPVSVQ